MHIHNRDETIEQAVALLRAGAVISFPTETVYALACAVDNQTAIDKIFKIKKRSKDTVLAILVSDLKMLQHYAETTALALKLIKRFSPGPLTYILKARIDVEISDALIKNRKIGLRIPDNPVAQEILKEYGQPIVATSVNLSGQKSATEISEIDDDIKNQISLIIDGGSCKLKEPSTVVDVSDSEIKIIRRGFMADAVDRYYRLSRT